MESVAWIDRTENLTSWVGSHPGGPLALDTEADSLHHYPEKVCLIQLSAGGDDALLDPLAELDPRCLRDTLEDPSRRKILHGADYDIRMLDRDFGLRICGIFDTMIASRLVGEKSFGLAALLESYLGVSLDKRFQRADWSLRPLSPEMRRYAVLDTRHLEELHGHLLAKLQELGRESWALEEFARLELLRWSGGPDPDAFRQIKGSSRLNARELAALKELHALRESIARRKDRPPFKILGNAVLIDLARHADQPETDLEATTSLPRRWTAGEGGRELREAISRARELPDEELPVRARGRRKRVEPEVESVLKKIVVGRDRLAEEIDLEPSLIASRATVEAIAQELVAGRDPTSVESLRQWQLELLRPTLNAL